MQREIIVANIEGEVIQFPVHEFSKILIACDADNSLKPDDNRYFDFAGLRGTSPVLELAETLQQDLNPGEHHIQILCGHRGSGKSTELQKLAEWANEAGYLSVWMDIYTYFGHVDNLQASDLYLIVAEYLVDTLNSETELSISWDMLPEIAEWYDEVINERKRADKSSVEAEVKQEMPQVFAHFKARREASAEHLMTARRRVRENFDSLADRTKKLLDHINREVKRQGFENGILLIFDSMDRYPETTIENLLLNSSLLNQLACHAIYTMHISLTYKRRGGAYDYFSGTPVILPMLALRDRDKGWGKTVREDKHFNPTAVATVLEAMKRRLDVDSVFEAPKDAELLIKMSGGCIRDLLHLINSARKFSVKNLNETPTKISSEGVVKGIARYRLSFTEGLSEADYTRLAKLAREKSSGDNLDAEVQKFLAERIALRYCQNDQRWKDVHPLVIETEGYQNALKAESKITKE